MKPAYVALLILVAALLAAGQMLFRIGAMRAEPVNDLVTAVKMMFLPIFVAARVLFGATTLLYIYILQNVPLSAAYPFMALALVLVPLLAVFLLGETVSLKYVGGLTLIIGGLLLTVQ